MSPTVSGLDERPQKSYFCIPNEAGGRELALVHSKYMDLHPEKLHLPSIDTLWSSFVAAYPCKQQE
jgi:hypothetical protein